MNIWIITTEYPPAFGGGIGTYCHHTVKMLKRHDENITIFVSDPSIDNNLITNEEGNSRIVRFKPGTARYYNYMGYSAALSYEFCDILERYIEKEGAPDIIETQEYAGIGYALLQKKWAMYTQFDRVPVVATIHTPKFLCDLTNQSPIYRFPDFWIGEMEKFVIKAADGIISPSKYMLNAIKQYTDVAEPSFVIPNPFDVSSFKPADIVDRGELFFVGRTEYRKGIIQALSYLSKMWDNGFSTPLKIIGGDTFFYPKKKMLKDYIRERFRKYIEKGLIIFEGKMPQEIVYQKISRSNAVILPSIFENFPTVAVESMALGKIVLASSSGGQFEMIEDGKSGFIFSYNNPDTFSDQLNKIMSLNNNEIIKIGQQARRRIEQISGYDVVYDKKIEAFKTIIEKSRKKLKNHYPFIREIDRENSGNNLLQSKKRLLSIVIPYFDMGDYIEDTVKSVLNVNYKPIEIIIVNDGSNEPLSIEMLYRLEGKYPIKIIHKNNDGLASTRNFGAKFAQGEYLGFVDADDLVAPNYHSWAIDIISRYDNISFVGCWASYFGDCEKTVWPTWNPEPPYLLIHNTLISGGLIYNREDFLNAGLNDKEMEYGMEDYESVVRMIRKGYSGIVIPEPLYQYRVRRDSMARDFNTENFLHLYRLLSEKNKSIYKQYATEVFGLLNANGPGFLYDNPTRNLPQVGFTNDNNKEIAISGIDSSNEIPYEAKQALKQLWSSAGFRKLVKFGINFKIYKIFK